LTSKMTSCRACTAFQAEALCKCVPEDIVGASAMIFQAQQVAYIACCPHCIARIPVIARSYKPVNSLIRKPDQARDLADYITRYREGALRRLRSDKNRSTAPMASGPSSTYGHQLDCAISAVRLASKLCQVHLVVLVLFFVAAERPSF